MTRTATAASPTPAPARARRHCPSPSPAPAGALVLGVFFLLVAAAFAAAVLAHPARPVFQQADGRWLRWMGGPHDGPYAGVAAVLNWLGGPLGVVVPVGLTIFLGVRRRWPSLVFLLLTYVVGNMVLVQILKSWVDRSRPAHPLVRVDHGSFPSGHSAGIALLVVVVGALFVPEARLRLWWIAGTVLTMAMMWSRTWLHAHWLSDTLAGAAAGAGAALVLWWLCTPLLAREGQASPGRPATAGAGRHED